jgi:hypothetical protein
MRAIEEQPLEEEQPPILATGKRSDRSNYLRTFLLVVFAQYTIISVVVGLTVAGTLRTFVTPQIVAKFEALADALKR